jgi:hypothetical protein
MVSAWPSTGNAMDRIGRRRYLYVLKPLVERAGTSTIAHHAVSFDV